MKGLSILAAVLGGAAIGAACGILFAPDKGSATRAAICDKGAELCDKGRIKGRELRDKIVQKLREKGLAPAEAEELAEDIAE